MTPTSESPVPQVLIMRAEREKPREGARAAAYGAGMEPGPVTADDLADVVAATDAALRAAPADADWWQPAHGLTWSCWETVEHLADDYFYYAVELVRPGGPGTAYLPIEGAARSEVGPGNTVRADPEAGPDGLLDVLASCGALLVASVHAAPPGARGRHTHGPADAEASAAMGALEAIAHTDDLAGALGVAWAPDPGICARVRHRLMPDVERTDDAWADLRWATGRAELPGRPRRTSWSWDNTPRPRPPRHRPGPGLGLATLVVPGYDEALAFYVDAAGFTLVEDTELEPGRRWVVVAPPGGTGAALLLARADDERQRARIGDQTGGRVALFLHTRDLAGDHARMRAAGVEFLEEPRHEPYGSVAVFTDPWGTRWDLMQPAP